MKIYCKYGIHTKIDKTEILMLKIKKEAIQELRTKYFINLNTA